MHSTYFPVAPTQLSSTTSSNTRYLGKHSSKCRNRHNLASYNAQSPIHRLNHYVQRLALCLPLKQHQTPVLISSPNHIYHTTITPFLIYKHIIINLCITPTNILPHDLKLNAARHGASLDFTSFTLSFDTSPLQQLLVSDTMSLLDCPETVATYPQTA